MQALRCIHKMQKHLCSKSISMCSKQSCHSYEAAVEALNGLQSNAQYLRNVRSNTSTHAKEYSNTILKVQKYLERSGISLENLDQLSVIHIAGTKGKGSTCAFCESILRHHGYRTGFYSSPHLFEVRERIRLDGQPISKHDFAGYFWELYNTLQNRKEDHYDMPAYFRFLTLLAFKIFLAEKVDVAIIEVGIGGEFDCTNVLRNVPVVGITSLDIDHTSLLGDTLEKIAWHKSGIMKKGCHAFTVPQTESAMNVIKERSGEKEVKTLKVINNKHLNDINNLIYFPTEVLATNAALSVALTEAWCKTCGNSSVDFKTSFKTKQGLANCFWPGRFQVLYVENTTYYIDGAHTSESLKICVSWFLEKTNTSHNKKVLIFNATGDRDSIRLLGILHNCAFDKVVFVPNVAKQHGAQDNKNYNIPENEQLSRCHKHRNIWLELNKKVDRTSDDGEIYVYECVADVFKQLHSESEYDVLVTGSLHLVGAVLSIIDPKLRDRNSYLQKNYHQNL